MSSVLRLTLFVWILLLGLRTASADIRFRNFDDPDEQQWQEREAALPAFPKDKNLREFYVSAVTANRFFVDAESIAVGADGVVRFSLVIKTAGGATNISYEGIRCDARQSRLYATGRADGTWIKARSSDWRPIENKPVNRHHAALSRDYFCPNGSVIRNADEGRNAVERGKHPDAS